MAIVAIVVHQQRPEAMAVALGAARWLTEQGHRVVVPHTDAADTGLHEWSAPLADISGDLDLAVSVGGDGTMLRTIELVLDHEVPVLGVNCGQLGYLTDVDGDASISALEDFLAGRHRVERRLALDVEVVRTGETTRHRALNEVVVETTQSGHTVRLA
ncbi:MAG TPA: NAD(+)/NADH kinase, partial [Acidimicrobiales bacterium]|nr:NAD(+)/NADH kinase [Acidimicrobiales bacterium]